MAGFDGDGTRFEITMEMHHLRRHRYRMVICEIDLCSDAKTIYGVLNSIVNSLAEHVALF